jgi:tetratricopeptide (TPR) repeat protein
MGETYYMLSNYYSAISCYSIAIEHSPNDFTIYSSRAHVYEMLGLHEDAEADRERYRELTE